MPSSSSTQRQDAEFSTSRKSNENSASFPPRARTKERRRTSYSLIRSAILVTFFFRVILLFDLIPSSLKRYISSDAFLSAVVNPLYTVDHLREGHFLLSLGNGGYGDAYKGQSFHLPPLVLASSELILSLPLSLYWQNVIWGLFLLAVDMGVASCLYSLGRTALLAAENSRLGIWERGLEQNMVERIQPHRAWVFGIELPKPAQRKVESTKGDSSDGANGVKRGLGPRTENSETVNVPTAPSSNESTVGTEKPGRSISPPGTESTHPLLDPIISISDIPYLSATVYFCNPITMVAGSLQNSLSLHNIQYLFILLAIREVFRYSNSKTSKDIGSRGGKTENVKDSVVEVESRESSGSIPIAMLYLSLVSYVELYHAVYLVPIVFIVYRSFEGGEGFIACENGSSKLHVILGCLGFFLLWQACLHLLSFILVGYSWKSVTRKTYGHTFGFTDLSPNLGMHWYFFVQMFDRFRQYFVILFGGMPYVFIAPLSIRLHRYPLALATAFSFIWEIHKPAPTLHDTCFLFSLLLLSPRTLARMGNASMISLFALAVPLTLYVLDYWLWLETGSGNANYMYFQCLAFNVFLAVIFLDFVSSTMKRDKALRITEKAIKSKKMGKTEKPEAEQLKRQS